MQVEVLAFTSEPLDLIGTAAGICYGKDDPSHKRVRNCIMRGHDSVLEHASATFRIGGISRACSHQLVRHRVGCSYTQQSQRYTAVKDAWDVVVPESIPDEKRVLYGNTLAASYDAYQALIEAGVRMEDARYVMPNACATEMVVTMNARALDHFLTLRGSTHAQWEIRALANAMEDALSAFYQWDDLLSMLAERRGER